MMSGAQNAYLENKMATGNPVELVALMYEAARSATREALGHLQDGNIEARSRNINRASEILLELVASLDHRRGGALSVRLAALYSYLLQRLLEANAKQAAEPLCEVLALLDTLGDGWNELARRQVEGGDCELPDAAAWHDSTAALQSGFGVPAWGY
jgi:flagellar protein FliS